MHEGFAWDNLKESTAEYNREDPSFVTTLYSAWRHLTFSPSAHVTQRDVLTRLFALIGVCFVMLCDIFGFIGAVA